MRDFNQRLATGARRTGTVCALSACAFGCGDDGGISDHQFGTVSDSMSEGSAEGSTDEGNSGADETGDAMVHAVDDYCLFDPMDGEVYGYRYQCEGSAFFEVEVTHPYAGSPTNISSSVEFGHEVDSDSYDEPLVMACCPWYEPSEPNCGQPHERACWIDLVEQGCKSLVGKLEAFADTFGFFEVAKRQAVLKIAEYVRTHQGDCVTAFSEEIAGVNTQCDESNNGLPFDDMVEASSWIFDPPGAVESVEITVDAAAWTGIFPIEGDDDEDPAVCWSADENDGVLFFEVDPAAGKVMHLASAQGLSLLGAEAEGTGVLSSASVLAITTGVAPTLDNLALHSAGELALTLAGVSFPVEAFHLRLWDQASAMVTQSALIIPPHAARFAASATLLNKIHVVFVTNATPIVVTTDVNGDWRTSEFVVEEEIRGRNRSLVVGSIGWQ